MDSDVWAVMADSLCKVSIYMCTYIHVAVFVVVVVAVVIEVFIGGSVMYIRTYMLLL